MHRSVRILIVLFVPLAAVLAGVSSGAPRGSARSAGFQSDHDSQLPGPPVAGAGTRSVDGGGAVGGTPDSRQRASYAIRHALAGSVARVLSGLKGLARMGGSPAVSGDGPRAAGTGTERVTRPGAPEATAGGSDARGKGASGAPAAGAEAGVAGTGRQAVLKAVIASALRARHRVKSPEELRVEVVIDGVFREYFRDFSVAGRDRTLRMPFGLNGEREGSRGYTQSFYLGGKGTPEELWKRASAVLATKEFAGYVGALEDPGEKALVFDLERRSFVVSREPELIRSLKTGSYAGTATRIFVYRSGQGVLDADIYNYLYAVASLGVDCSGLVHHVHQAIGLSCGADLDRELAKTWRTRAELVRFRVGLGYYDPAAGNTEPIDDRIEDLRPGDLLLFEGSDGSFKHSAVIQSVDFEQGLIRYLQSTDWALQSERGVHESWIRFDPAHPEVDLRHYSVRWLHQVRPPFEGETEPRDWVDDGDRYLWYLDAGGSRAVRLKSLAAVLLEREPQFYTNLYAPGGPPEFAPP